MKLDKHKFERQKKGFYKWKDAGYKGTWEWATGMGKTFASCMAIKKIATADFKVCVVVPRVPLLEQWTDEAKRIGVYKYIEINTVHMLVKDTHDVDLLILDELHMYVGEQAEVFPTIFEKVKAKMVLGLSASVGTSEIRLDLIEQYCPIIDRISTDEAVREGWLSPYIQYNLGLKLSSSDRLKYNKLDSKFHKWFSTFHYDFNLLKKTLQYDSKEKKLKHPQAKALARRIHWDHERLYIHALNAMRVMKERKQFLYENPTKLEVAKQIVELLPDDKIITFGQTTDPADQLADMIGNRARSYHSNLATVLVDEDENFIGRKVGKDKYKLKDTIYSWNEIKDLDQKVKRFGTKTLRKYILDWYKSKSNGVLCTATALDVGFDDEDITVGIVISATSKDRQNIQRTGRIIRAKEGKQAKIIQLYIMDTQDEKWLDKRQTSNNVKDIVNINQIL